MLVSAGPPPLLLLILVLLPPLLPPLLLPPPPLPAHGAAAARHASLDADAAAQILPRESVPAICAAQSPVHPVAVVKRASMSAHSDDVEVDGLSEHAWTAANRSAGSCLSAPFSAQKLASGVPSTVCSWQPAPQPQKSTSVLHSWQIQALLLQGTLQGTSRVSRLHQRKMMQPVRLVGRLQHVNACVPEVDFDFFLEYFGSGESCAPFGQGGSAAKHVAY
jgi:hypothetical protein